MRRILFFVPFVLVFLGIWGGLHFYVWSRLVRDPAVPAPWSTLLGLVFVVFAFSPLVTRAQGVPRRVAGVLHEVGLGWFGLAGLLAVATFGTDLARLGLGLASGGFSDVLQAARVQALAAAGIGVGLAAIAWVNAHRRIPIKRVELEVTGWPAALDGYRIVQLSDVHVSPSTDVAWVRDLVDRTNAERPDLVAITGDLVDGGPAQLAGAMAPLAELKGRHGNYFVTGNHEYYSGGDRWIAFNRGLGLTVLQNERVTIGEGAAAFELAGVPDWRGGTFGAAHEPRLADTLAGAPEGRPVVLLAHQPRQFPEAADRGVALQLSGHTHGGQVWPFTYAVRLAEPFPAGLYRRGRSALYVSRGTGWWGPAMRLGAPMELTVLTLRTKV